MNCYSGIAVSHWYVVNLLPFRMKKLLFFILLSVIVSCSEKKSDNGRTPILEVEGKFLYKDETDKIIPPNSTGIDSADIADRYIKKWATEVLMYENAKRNIDNLDEINKLADEYRQSLIIHAYEQALVAERLDPKISEKEAKNFYEEFKTHLTLEDNLIKGMLLIVPVGAPQMEAVKEWVRKGDNKSLEKIEKYSLQNAISYDYFMNKWTPFTEITKKAPFVTENTSGFVLNTRFAEVSDSINSYLLHISKAIAAGDTEPYDYAKERITTTLLNRKKSDFIITFEKNVYNDALKKGNIKFYKKK